MAQNPKNKGFLCGKSTHVTIYFGTLSMRIFKDLLLLFSLARGTKLETDLLELSVVGDKKYEKETGSRSSHCPCFELHILNG